jgi:hypothetical protein
MVKDLVLDYSSEDGGANKLLARLLDNLVVIKALMYRNKNQHRVTGYYQHLKGCQRLLDQLYMCLAGRDDHCLLAVEEQDDIIAVLRKATDICWRLLQECEKTYICIRRSLLLLGHFLPFALTCSAWCASTWMACKDYMQVITSKMDALSVDIKDPELSRSIRLELMRYKQYLKSANGLACDETIYDTVYDAAEMTDKGPAPALQAEEIFIPPTVPSHAEHHNELKQSRFKKSSKRKREKDSTDAIDDIFNKLF